MFQQDSSLSVSILAVRRGGHRRARIAALEGPVGRDAQALGARLTRVDHRRQLLVVDPRQPRRRARRIVAVGRHREDRLADVLDQLDYLRDVGREDKRIAAQVREARLAMKRTRARTATTPSIGAARWSRASSRSTRRPPPAAGRR